MEASVDPGAGASMAVSLPPTGPSPCTYARVSTLEGVPFTDILEYVEEPTSYFIGQGLLLKEAVYDMEWTKGDVAVELRRDPSLLKFTSSNQGRAIEVGGAWLRGYCSIRDRFSGAFCGACWQHV